MQTTNIHRWIITFLAIWLIPLILPAQSFQFKDLDYPYPTHQVSLGEDIELTYIDEGEGSKTLLFIHGLNAYLPVWQKNIDSLRQHYRCVALDLPGFGKSTKGEYPYTIAFFAEQVLSLADKLDLENLYLVGHSLGGQIAAKAALMQPEQIQGLVLMAPTGLESFSDNQIALLKSFSSPQYYRNLSDVKLRSNLQANFYQWPKEAEFMLHDRIKARQAPDFDRFTQASAQTNTSMLDEPIKAQLPDIRVPTLLLFGSQDSLVPNAYFSPDLKAETLAQQAQAQIPDARYQIIPEAGHLVQFEKASEVNAAIRQFVK